jgi:hypothetical protein
MGANVEDLISKPCQFCYDLTAVNDPVGFKPKGPFHSGFGRFQVLLVCSHALPGEARGKL